jgi:hypothetical protein
VDIIESEKLCGRPLISKSDWQTQLCRSRWAVCELEDHGSVLAKDVGSGQETGSTEVHVQGY